MRARERATKVVGLGDRVPGTPDGSMPLPVGFEGPNRSGKGSKPLWLAPVFWVKGTGGLRPRRSQTKS